MGATTLRYSLNSLLAWRCVVAEAVAMEMKDAGSRLRWSGIALCLACFLLLVPASVLAHAGMHWLDLPWPSGLSAAAMTITPLPLLLGAFYARKAARRPDRASLLKGIASVVIALLLYVVVWAWGGRMLL